VIPWLWFDALLKWETVSTASARPARGCDLMLYWNEKQYYGIHTITGNGCDLMLYWNEKQSAKILQKPSTVVIWCSIEMRNSGSTRTVRQVVVVIWCSIEMRNSCMSVAGTVAVLWFDALLKWETVKNTETLIQILLWFDALLKWETVLPLRSMSPLWLWFDALLKWETVPAPSPELPSSCDLMLYWNEKQ